MYRQTSGLGDGTPSAGDVEMQSGRCEPRFLGLVHAEDKHEQQFGKDGGNGNLNEQVEVDVQSVQGEGNLELQSRQGRENNHDQVQGQQRGYLNDDFPSDSIIELSIVMALGFLGIAYQNNKESKNNPIVTTAVPFKLMMLSLAVTVSASMAGGFFLHFLPCFSKILHGASLFSFILQLSVLMWVSLPTNLKLVAWCFSLFLLFSLLARILCPNRVCVVGSDAEAFTTSSSQSKICKAITHSTMTITQAIRNLVAAMYRQTSGLEDGTPSAGDLEMQSDPCEPGGLVHAEENDEQQFGQDGVKGNSDEQGVTVEVQSGQRDCNLELQSRQGREGNLDQVQGQQRGFLDDDFPSRSRIIDLSLVMALGFLGIAYQNNIKSKNNSLVTTAVPFKLMMLSLAITVSASMAGGFFLHFLPCFSKILHGAWLFSLILQLSVLMWVSLPTKVAWFSLFLLFSLLARFLCPNRSITGAGDRTEHGNLQSNLGTYLYGERMLF